MTHWEFWLGLGLLLAILEVIDGSFFLLSLGLGFMLTAIPAANGVESTSLLLASCAINQLIIFLLVRPLAMRSMSKDTHPTNANALIGKTGLVMESIDGETHPGYVRVESEEWRALASHPMILEKGDRVLVEKISGATLYVQLVSRATPTPEAGET